MEITPKASLHAVMKSMAMSACVLVLLPSNLSGSNCDPCNYDPGDEECPAHCDLPCQATAYSYAQLAYTVTGDYTIILGDHVDQVEATSNVAADYFDTYPIPCEIPGGGDPSETTCQDSDSTTAPLATTIATCSPQFGSQFTARTWRPRFTYFPCDASPGIPKDSLEADPDPWTPVPGICSSPMVTGRVIATASSMLTRDLQELTCPCIPTFVNPECACFGCLFDPSGSCVYDRFHSGIGHLSTAGGSYSSPVASTAMLRADFELTDLLIDGLPGDASIDLGVSIRLTFRVEYMLAGEPVTDVYTIGVVYNQVLAMLVDSEGWDVVLHTVDPSEWSPSVQYRFVYTRQVPVPQGAYELSVKSTGGMIGEPSPAVWSKPTPGDLNGDGVLDLQDLEQMLALIGSADPRADLNRDGIVDAADLAMWIQLSSRD